MGRKVKDLTGKRFGRLTAIRDTGQRTKGGKVVWKCVCDCGNTKKIIAVSLYSGITQSCGYLAREKAQLLNLTSKVSSNNKSGIKGLYWEERSQKWVAQIYVNGKHKHLGRFIDKEDAIKA
ncbi:AP2 domain-containing protein [Bacillus sp. ok061]|uniref:AP2 domain-containing protein n=1 Tax=Bacillus sp. ok061 TaxID=1761766 RepID=UPI00089EEB3B|nr:AP2 domain-containing protein [Bacillus sp. ok061]SEG81626.1 AP2 domain-containing protein [Bacillus sp. ok061]